MHRGPAAARPRWWRPRRIARWLRTGACVVALVGGGGFAIEPPIAAGGFDRPERLASLDGVYGSEVAVAPDAERGPVFLWQDQDGLLSRPATSEGAPERYETSLGVRGVWAGAAAGEPVVVWLDRDLSSGTSTLRWRWAGETQAVLETRQAPQVAVVRNGARPELVVAVPTPDGWRLSLHDWAGSVRTSAARPEAIARIDAVRDGDRVRLAWLEGRDRRVLGRVDADWNAWVAVWPDGASSLRDASDLGDAAKRSSRDAALFGGPDGSEVAFTRPDGTLVRSRSDGTETVLGRGTPVGWLDGRWTWLDGIFVRREDGGGGTETVLRLPSEPGRLAATEAGGTVGLVWSSGRFEGGLEVWGADDAVAYRSGPLERFALQMGWDPWRIWTAAGGHLLLAALVALIAAMAFGPAWWLGAVLLARRRAASTLAATLDGTALGVLSVVAVAVPVAVRVARLGGPGAALLVDPAWLLAGVVAGAVVPVALLVRRDLDATLGRLLAAALAGSTVVLVLGFGTLSAWQRILVGSA